VVNKTYIGRKLIMDIIGGAFSYNYNMILVYIAIYLP